MIWGLLALVIAAAFAGALTWCKTGVGHWLAGAIVLVANCPFTLFVIRPINRQLIATAPDSADATTRALLKRW
jgi:uncharacterized membrane protein